MTVDECSKMFNSILDNNISTVGLILPVTDVYGKDESECLNGLAYRLQIEFGKTVVLLSYDHIESELDTYTKSDDPHIFVPKYADSKYVFICLFKSPYFKQDNTWYIETVNMLTYYRKQFFGFSTNDTRLSVF